MLEGLPAAALARIEAACPCAMARIHGSLPTLPAFACFLWLASTWTAAHAADPPTIELAELDGRTVVVVRGLSEIDLDALRSPSHPALSVRVTDTPANVPAMLGTQRVERGKLVFIPRFALKPNLQYRVELRLPGNETIQCELVAHAAQRHLPPPRVTNVYPSSHDLPENLLRFYLHFATPMSRGDSYRHIRLVEIDSEGGERVVADPFVEIDQELWDPTGTRLTVLFDPGRIKQGLRPHEELGRALEAGRSYALVVDDTWRDADGNPLVEPFRKVFRATPADATQPETTRWHIAAPTAGTRDRLTVTLDEPLDHGMLHRVLQVEASGEPIAGSVSVDREETRWQFEPEDPWPSGQLQIVVEPILEDVAGNSLERPFEERLDRPADNAARSRPRIIPFQTVDAP